MSLQFYLIDFENVQPTSVGTLKPGTCRIKVFLGQSQAKVPVDLWQALEREDGLLAAAWRRINRFAIE